MSASEKNPLILLVVATAMAAIGSLAVAEAGDGDTKANREQSTPVRMHLADDSPPINVDNAEGELEVDPASFLQPQPLLTPRIEARPSIPLPGSALATGNLAPRRVGLGSLTSTSLGQPKRGSLGIVYGEEASIRATSDAGSLLRKSPAALGIGTQRRTPIVTDPRIRGSRVGELAASGSFWVPARIDLDTMVSKIDSHIVDDVILIKGPYSSRYGPGFHFMDIALLDSPRFADGFDTKAASFFEYQTNGEQVHGRQMIWGGDSTWGYRFGYSHRTGNNYRTGAGSDVPASYNSREFDLSLGRDLTPDSRIEFQALRLDQTDVEYPGQAFDMDFLKTDGYELTYTSVAQPQYDLLTVEVWYNRTVFAGNAQNAGKRATFPFYDFIDFVGNTDVDSMSLGYQIAATWGDADTGQLTAGTDLRYLKQELNEITSGRIGFAIWTDANSPIPRSDWLDTGFFAEWNAPVGDRLNVTAGVRADVVNADVIDDPTKLSMVGIAQPQSSFAEIVGSNEFEQNFVPWSAYLTAEYDLECDWVATGGLGFGQRPPSLTELYAAEPFMFLLQNGLNTVTGDPRLAKEKLYQIDFGVRHDGDRWRGGINGFHAWANDYITFENMRVVLGPPMGQVEQVNLKYVNTDLATFSGGDLWMEYDLNPWLTPFATVQYVQGTDRSRNGNFATRQASPGQPSIQDPNMIRGSFSGTTGNNVEPLPGISPLESRLGIRLHQPGEFSAWVVEFSARIVDGQDRVAESLLESTTPGFAVFDVRGQWQPRDSLIVIAGVENLADRTYREHLDFRSQNGIQVFQPGVNFYSSVEWLY